MAEIERDFDDFISLPYNTLITIGYDFQDKPKSVYRRYLMNFYMILSLICCMYCTYLVGQEIAVEIWAGVQNLPVLLRLINDLNYNAVGLLKTVYFVLNLKGQKIIFRRFKEIFPKTIQERFAYKVNENYWPRWIRVMLYLYFGATTCILFSPLAASLVEYVIDWTKLGYEDTYFTYHKMYDEQTYLVDHHNPVGYIVIYAIEAMNGHYSIISNIGPDIWLVAYAIQLCMHFDYISRSLEEYEPKDENTADDDKFIKMIIHRHQKLLSLAEDLKANFSSLVFVMLFSTVGNLGCAGIYMITKGFTQELLGYLGFFTTSMGQYYMVCFYGQAIIDKSLEVAAAVYNQGWYNASATYKKSILLTLGRAQRQCEINAGGFQTTNLQSFRGVMSMSFQLYTVSRSMIDQKQ